MKGRIKKFFVALCLLPMVVFFPACKTEYQESVKNNQYENMSYTVRFYTDSVESFNITNQTVKHGELLREPTPPTKKGYRFIGWYTDTSWEQLWIFSIHTVSHDMTLFARWEKRV